LNGCIALRSQRHRFREHSLAPKALSEYLLLPACSTQQQYPNAHWYRGLDSHQSVERRSDTENMGHWVDIEDDSRHLLLVVVEYTLARYSLALGLAVAGCSLGLGLVMIVVHRPPVEKAKLDLGMIVVHRPPVEEAKLDLVVIVVHKPSVEGAKLDRTVEMELVREPSAEPPEPKHPRMEFQYQTDGFEVNSNHPTQQWVEHCKTGQESVVERNPDPRVASYRSMAVCVLLTESGSGWDQSYLLVLLATLEVGFDSD
jgi:hypothetical protein